MQDLNDTSDCLNRRRDKMVEVEERTLQNLMKADRLLNLSISGVISSLLSVKDDPLDVAKRIVSSFPQQPPPEYRPFIAELISAERELAVATSANDFPSLRATAIISMWTATECFIEDVAAAWLAETPDAVHLLSVSKIKILLAEYNALDAVGGFITSSTNCNADDPPISARILPA